MIEKLTHEHLKEVLELFNHAASSKEYPYELLSESQAELIFLGHQSFSFVYRIEDEIIGFISGYHCKKRQTGFMTFIYVLPTYRHQMIGTQLLHKLESVFTGLEQIKQIEISYHNPHQLIWVIDQTPHHVHPNAPGVELDSAAYYFFKHHHYVQTSIQNNYHRFIDDFCGSGISEDQALVLEIEQIKMEYYDPKKHVQLNELFDDFDHKSWRDIIMENANANDPFPLLIISQDNVVKGFTGPLYVQEDGRGYFSGIGVHSSIRGYKAGKYLFYGLCNSLKDLGATYMSLFTREDNYARYIYEKAGFKLVKSWACFEKTID